MRRIPALTCIEVGGSGCETVTFETGDRFSVSAGTFQRPGSALALAVPGLVGIDGRTWASNLGWMDVDPVAELGLTGPARVVMNDAAAAALGESALRSGRDLTFIGLGTGVGGAVVSDGSVHDNLFGHGGGFGTGSCPCGDIGCLETVAAGWALPEPLGIDQIAELADALAAAVAREPLATPDLIVVGGGLARSYPNLVRTLAERCPRAQVEASAAPAMVKSAAAWGLRHALAVGPTVVEA